MGFEGVEVAWAEAAAGAAVPMEASTPVDRAACSRRRRDALGPGGQGWAGTADAGVMAVSPGGFVGIGVST
ncbi:hypothetical protein AB851_17395 [Ralstonia pseudosolanacearum]|nr:hypothetical protein AB851_17395 [Ralstonia pseudosolanacearum]